MTAIAAVRRKRRHRPGGALLFHIREDLRRFRQLTLGKTSSWAAGPRRVSWGRACRTGGTWCRPGI